MTPFLTSRLRILTAAFAFAAAPALFAQGDMESDWLPNTTLFFDELLPSHADQDEAETLADLARIFDNSLLLNQFTDADIEKFFEMAAKHPDNEAFFSPLVQAVVQPRSTTKSCRAC